MKLNEINKKRKAGCVVKYKDKFLLINKNNKWQLPKGKQKKNEPLNKTALREVQEETGVDIYLKNLDPYSVGNTTFFAAKAISIKTEPSIKEGITECGWFEIKEALHKIMPEHLYILKHFS